MAVMAAIVGFIVLALQGCAGDQFSLGSSTQPPTDEAAAGPWRAVLSRSQTNAMSLWLNSNSPETNSKADRPPAPP